MGNLWSGARHRRAPPPCTSPTSPSRLSTKNNNGFSDTTNKADDDDAAVAAVVLATVRPAQSRKRTRQSDAEDDSSTNKNISTGGRRVRSRGSEAALQRLARSIVQKKNVVFVTGAGLSVASGIRPFRSNPSSLLLQKTSTDYGDDDQHYSEHDENHTHHNQSRQQQRRKQQQHQKHILQAGLWHDVIWSTATRQSFRKDPVKWYNEFWIPHFWGQGSATSGRYRPNRGHHALQSLLKSFDNVKQITQNIDGLQQNGDDNNNEEATTSRRQLIEVHGRANLFKCCPDSDTDDCDSDDNDSDSDDDERRTVHLGHRRKSRLMRQRSIQDRQQRYCPYQYLESLTADQLEPYGAFGKPPPPLNNAAAITLSDSSSSSNSSRSAGTNGIRGSEQWSTQPVSISEETLPCCPACGNVVMPQALLFDEGYHSHSFYQFETVEDWLHAADVLVFVGTSFAVRLTQVALQHARDNQLPVYNFNLQHDVLKSTARLNVSNIVGPATETLPKLLDACHRLQDEERPDSHEESSNT